MSPSVSEHDWHYAAANIKMESSDIYDSSPVRPTRSAVTSAPTQSPPSADSRSRAEMVKDECIAADKEFLEYLDEKGRISVKQLRETPKLRHLYKIYDRVSVQLCRAERRRNASAHTPPPSPKSRPSEQFDDDSTSPISDPEMDELPIKISTRRLSPSAVAAAAVAPTKQKVGFEAAYRSPAKLRDQDVVEAANALWLMRGPQMTA